VGEEWVPQSAARIFEERYIALKISRFSDYAVAG